MLLSSFLSINILDWFTQKFQISSYKDLDNSITKVYCKWQQTQESILLQNHHNSVSVHAVPCTVYHNELPSCRSDFDFPLVLK